MGQNNMLDGSKAGPRPSHIESPDINGLVAHVRQLIELKEHIATAPLSKIAQTMRLLRDHHHRQGCSRFPTPVRVPKELAASIESSTPVGTSTDP